MTDLDMDDLRAKAAKLIAEGNPDLWRFSTFDVLTLLDVIAERDATIAAALASVGSARSQVVRLGQHVTVDVTSPTRFPIADLLDTIGDLDRILTEPDSSALSKP